MLDCIWQGLHITLVAQIYGVLCWKVFVQDEKMKHAFWIISTGNGTSRLPSGSSQYTSSSSALSSFVSLSHIECKRIITVQCALVPLRRIGFSTRISCKSILKMWRKWNRWKIKDCVMSSYYMIIINKQVPDMWKWFTDKDGFVDKLYEENWSSSTVAFLCSNNISKIFLKTKDERYLPFLGFPKWHW